ncbi:glycosyltransferase [Candidatus Latescibacterota bacterium]
MAVLSLDRSSRFHLMAGLPVVGSDTPAIREVMEDTGAGPVVDAADPAAIGHALCSLRDDEGLRRQLADAARRAARDLCWEREAPKLVSLYADL